ncbi:DUF2971 domain-containing protein [Plesiomonas shigelloides]|uniref:DUF2971 domain-containing protein n=1 Tax=Plesiomonas shigelloides TaxID=703 RepID=UPI00387F149F
MEANLTLIYHYTNVGGLKGICGEDKAMLRSTDSRYLSDKNEITYGIEIAKKQVGENLSKMFIRSDIPSAQEFISRMVCLANDSLFYTTSFCNEGDKLSQWQEYASYGDGFSIGFDRNDLQAFINKSDFNLVDVNYSDIMFKSILHAMEVEQVKDPVQERVLRDLELYKAYPMILDDIASAKNDTYHSEDEVRAFLVNRIQHLDKQQICYFDRGSQKVPFIPLWIDKRIIKEVIVGPNCDKTLAMNLLHDIKFRYEYEFEIKYSLLQ